MFGRAKTKTKRPDPRPVAETNCWGCGTLAGDKHEWSCEQVPAELFTAWLEENYPGTTKESDR